jgi:archaellum component FlaC
MNETSNDLGHLRRKLGGGGGWLDEIHNEFKPQIDGLKDGFKRWLDGLSDDDLKKDAVMARVKQEAKDLGELSRRLGDDGAWSAEINDEIKRRSK